MNVVFRCSRFQKFRPLAESSHVFLGLVRDESEMNCRTAPAQGVSSGRHETAPFQTTFKKCAATVPPKTLTVDEERALVNRLATTRNSSASMRTHKGDNRPG